MATDLHLPTRRNFLATAAAAGAVSLVPSALKAGETDMAIKDEIRPSMDAAQTPVHDLFLLDEVEGKATGSLAANDRQALREVAGWTRTFITQPNKDLGRPGPVCPFVPVALEHKTLWLAPQRSAGRSTSEIVRLVQTYQRRLLDAQPVDGVGGDHKSMMIVFTDLPATKAKDFFDGVLKEIGTSSYADHGIVMGPFYEGNEGTAIYNANFRPFTSPVPSLLMRRAVLSDWKFFLNNEALFSLWARRYGESATNALATELRRLPWQKAMN